MSTFMVEDKTINRIVTWLSKLIEENSWYEAEWGKQAGINTSLPGWENTLGRRMINLNASAVNYRYGEGTVGKDRTQAYQYQSVCSSQQQTLKSMQCWLYQCMEGEVPKRPLYRFFKREVVPVLTEMIATDSAEYRHAEWG